MNLGEKEKLSSSILMGAFSVVEKPIRETAIESIDALSPGLTKKLAHMKRHGFKQKFLQLDSMRADIHSLDPVTAKAMEVHRLANIDGNNQTYTFGGQQIVSNSLDAPPATVTRVSIEMEKQLRTAKKTSLSDAVQRARM